MGGARFFNEARAVNRVEHTGLVQISDYGQQPDGTAYIVMEYLKGESLAQRIERCGRKLPAAEVINLNLQIADALAAAHAKDIVHRDLKPENVMIVPDPHMPGGERTKLLDFGIAKVLEPGDRPRVQTKTAQLMGTPMYMSPEQCEGAGRVDAKSDVYSLGVMMFEMLAGQLPFDADGPGKLLGMHMFTPPPLLKEVAPEVPEDLAALVQRLLVKPREERPSMAEVLAELTGLAGQHPLARPADVSRHAMPPLVNPLASTQLAAKKSTLENSASQAAARPPRRSRRLIALLLGGALLVAAGVAMLKVTGLPLPTMLRNRLYQAVRLVAPVQDPQPAAPQPASPAAEPQTTAPPPKPPEPPSAPAAAPVAVAAAGPTSSSQPKPAPPLKPAAPKPKPTAAPKPAAPRARPAPVKTTAAKSKVKAPVRKRAPSKPARAVKSKQPVRKRK